MGSFRNGPPEDLVLLLKEHFNLTHFIETGTCHGDTAAWASKHFPQVTTVEFSEKFFKEASEKYKHLPNIHFRFQDSRAACRELVPKLDKPALFWIDSHWCGDDAFGKDDQCPLLEEIDILNQAKATHFLLIDDARLFLSPPCEPHPVEQWPPIDAIIEHLKKSSHRYFIVVFEDVIIAVPEYAKDVLIGHCRDINTKNLHAQIQMQQMGEKPSFKKGLDDIERGFKTIIFQILKKLEKN